MAHERNKDRCANLQSKLLGHNEVAAFVNEQQKSESDRELPSPKLGVNPDHQQHRPAGFQEQWQKLEQRNDRELELRKKLRDQNKYDPNRPEHFLRACRECFAFRRGDLLLRFHRQRYSIIE